MNEEQAPAAMEEILDEVILWQDHAHHNGYRPTLRLITFPNREQALELNVHGRVYRTKYIFPFLERDRL